MFDSTQIINKVTYNGTSISFPSYNASAPLLEKVLTNTFMANTITLSGVKYLGNKTAQNFNSATLKVVNLPDCIWMGTSPFTDGPTLTSISAPKLKYLGNMGMQSPPLVNFPNVEALTTAGLLGYASKVTLISLPKVNTISYTGGYGVLFSCANLSAVYFNGLYNLNLSSGSFITYCPALTIVELPKLKTLKRIAPSTYIAYNPTIIDTCNALTSLNLPNLELLSNSYYSASTNGIGIVRNCSNLETVSLPNLKKITGGGTVFATLPKVTEISLPNCSYLSIDFYMANNCALLSKFYAPNCNLLNHRSNVAMFSNCPALAEVTLGSQLSSFSGSSMFAGCTALKSFTFPSTLSAIYGGGIFNGCTSLSQIVLYGLTILNEATVFTNTPLSNSTYLGYYGSIYVPSEYVDMYKVMTNWSLYSDRITSLENLGG